TALSLAAVDFGEKILDNIYINGVDVGGLSGFEALEILEISCPIGEKEIKIGDNTYTFGDFGAGYDFAAAVGEAVEFSDSGGLFKKMRKKRDLKSAPMEISANFSYDDSKISEIIGEISAKEYILPVDASYSLENGNFVITDEQMGREVDETALQAEIIAIILGRVSGATDIPTIQLSPKFTYEDFSKSTQLLGGFTTPFDQSRAERAKNLATASNYLHNQTILPGETLSVCQVLRPRILENGYVEAGQIIGGLPAQGVGGGICQISSTLYMAALHAEMDIVERRNHSLMVAYSGPATDATIAEGLIDLKIRNHTNYPMLVQSTLNRHSHIVNIYGNESRPAGRSIAFESVLVETTPHEDKFVECPDLPPNYTQIASFGMDGAKFELHKVITENGEEKRTKVNTSTYRPLHRIIKIGVDKSL
ncbi:MAG: VanW family protein, partial [Defluviitaleaceae bacterium]|nr:VanW family protein [Defluviitaleaceae bacterium]